jgi:hypothetical protein
MVLGAHTTLCCDLQGARKTTVDVEGVEEAGWVEGVWDWSQFVSSATPSKLKECWARLGAAGGGGSAPKGKAALTTALQSLEPPLPFFSPDAVDYCARKVAKSTGDYGVCSGYLGSVVDGGRGEKKRGKRGCIVLTTFIVLITFIALTSFFLLTTYRTLL